MKSTNFPRTLNTETKNYEKNTINYAIRPPLDVYPSLSLQREFLFLDDVLLQKGLARSYKDIHSLTFKY